MLVLVVLAFGLLTAVVLIGGRSLLSSRDPLDPQRQEQWLVAHAPRWLAGLLRSIDRRVVGGAMVGAFFIVLFAAALGVGWVLSGTDDGSGIARWDVAAAEWGRDHATRTSTTILGALTNFGSTVPLMSVMVLIGVYHAVRRNDRGPAIYLAIVGIGVTLINNALKLIVDRDRPDIAQLAGHSGPSFPSGHSAAAAACWAAIALVVARRSSRNCRFLAATLAAVVAVVVATTRVLLGVHWLSDVVAGVVVGWAWFLLSTLAVGGRSLRLGEPAERIADTTADPIEDRTPIDQREDTSGRLEASAGCSPRCRRP